MMIMTIMIITVALVIMTINIVHKPIQYFLGSGATNLCQYISILFNTCEYLLKNLSIFVNTFAQELPSSQKMETLNEGENKTMLVVISFYWLVVIIHEGQNENETIIIIIMFQIVKSSK